jgi:alpha-tubulin suppressor-like RCC1 family protein
MRADPSLGAATGYKSASRWFARLFGMLCCVVLLSACERLSDEEYAAVKDWLGCDECDSVQRARVAAIGADVKTILAEALIGLSDARRDNLRQQFAASYNRIRSQVADSAEFVNRYLSDFESVVQKRAAQSLGDIGAVGELREALDSVESRGYRDDVVREIYRAISRATNTIRWVQISADTGYSCGVWDSGDAFCWGGSNHGEMGAGSAIDTSHTPVRVAFGGRFESVVTAWGHTCGLASDSTVYCWGLNNRGQLGDGSVEGERSRPGPVPSGFAFESLVAGGLNVCADSVGGSVYCWGANQWGQVGDGTNLNTRPLPTRVSGSLSFTEVSFGVVHTCGLTSDSLAYCWGNNDEGQLGDGTTTNRTAPDLDVGVASLVSVVAGNRYSCAIADGGLAYCWGRNSVGQLGDGTLDNRLMPDTVNGGHRFSSLSAGSGLSAHTCGVTLAGAVYCWGSNSHGQLGDGSTTDRIEPVLVNTSSMQVMLVSAGMRHTCAVTVDGSAYCWGQNSDGRLGDGTSVDRSQPAQVAGPPIP